MMYVHKYDIPFKGVIIALHILLELVHHQAREQDVQGLLPMSLLLPGTDCFVVSDHRDLP